MKKIIVLVLIAILSIQCFVFADEEYPPIEVIVDGSRLPTFDFEQGLNTPAILYQDRTLLPLRKILQVFGIPSENILWNGEEKSVTLVAHNGDIIVLYINRDYVVKNGQEFKVYVPPIINNQRTYIPVTMFSSLLGETYEWDAERRAVILTPSEKRINEYDLNFKIDPVLGYTKPFRVSSKVGYILESTVNEEQHYMIIKEYDEKARVQLADVALSNSVSTEEYLLYNNNIEYYQYKIADLELSTVLSVGDVSYEITTFGLTHDQLEAIMRTFIRGD